MLKFVPKFLHPHLQGRGWLPLTVVMYFTVSAILIGIMPDPVGCLRHVLPLIICLLSTIALCILVCAALSISHKKEDRS
jgi:hypothetical protein